MYVVSVKRVILWLLVAASLVLAGCGPNATLAPSIGEPNTRPARNFTSFSQSLRCMDRLLKQSGRGPVLISSNGFPDNTEDLDVGADDMLINAISQMNASNRRYVFLDQALLKDFGQLEILTTRKDEEQAPQIYIRGSISQIDERTVETGGSATYSASTANTVTDAYFRGSRKLSVISVDMHLVRFPSRQVLAGGSVANSMVVTQRRLDGRVSGLISQGTLGIPLYMERIESKSQAVRNLIEVGAIELLGRHSGVPYWTCLETPDTNAKRNEKRERRDVSATDAARISEAQQILAAMGLLPSGYEPGTLDAATRRAVSTFQSRNRLLPNGIVDFDTLDALRRSAPIRPKPTQTVRTTRAEPAAPKPAAPKPAREIPPPVEPAAAAPAIRRPSCPNRPGCDEHFQNLYDFINGL